LAKASEQFRQSDVTRWGLVALVAGGLAVFGANVSAMLPAGILSGLHKTRIEGASVDQLRAQVADLSEQTLQLRRDNAMLAARFALEERDGDETVRRVGALEVSLPRLLEDLPAGAFIDQSSITSSIGTNQTLIYDADGGSVAIQQRPITDIMPPIVDPQQTASVGGEARRTGFGIAIGSTTTAETAANDWQELSMKLGPLMLGLEPVLADEADSVEKRILVGPFNQLTEATALCQRLEQVSIACMPMPYEGTPLLP
jgi:hypothetical protein